MSESNSSTDFHGWYLPVNLPESPASSSPQKNLTGLPRVIRDISADIYNNIQQWNKFHNKGARLIKQIALLKSDCLDIYPEGLEALAVHLNEIVTNLEKVIDVLVECAKQMRSTMMLYKSPLPMFISWPSEKMATTADAICDAYIQEFQSKKFVAENMPHILGKEKVMFYAACWTHQPYITSDVAIALESLLTETGHRSKT